MKVSPFGAKPPATWSADGFVCYHPRKRKPTQNNSTIICLFGSMNQREAQVPAGWEARARSGVLNPWQLLLQGAEFVCQIDTTQHLLSRSSAVRLSKLRVRKMCVPWPWSLRAQTVTPGMTMLTNPYVIDRYSS